MSKPKSVHGARTIMFAELEKVMAFASEDGQYLDAMRENVFAKKSNSGIKHTKGYLIKLYGFDIKTPSFIAFKYFWGFSESNEKPLLAMLFAICNDVNLQESINIIQKVKLGEKVSIELLEENIEKYHPNKYSVNTRRSMAQNIASSWKQAGFIEGKMKNIRVQPVINYRISCFSFLLAYLAGCRGEFIWKSTVVSALCLGESSLRELAIECARKDLMQYQYAGSVTSINFTQLLNKIGINGDSN
jgi:hypothetical protein